MPSPVYFDSKSRDPVDGELRQQGSCTQIGPMIIGVVPKARSHFLTPLGVAIGRW